jgi:hypothetical protein
MPRQPDKIDLPNFCTLSVKVAVLNDEFSVEKLAVLTMTSATANSTSARRAA